MENKKIDYHARKTALDDRIRDLNFYHIDTNNYIHRINEIDSNIKKQLIKDEYSIDEIYSNAVNELDEIIKEIDNKYIKFISLNNYVRNIKETSEKITSENIDILIKYTLDLLNAVKTIDDDNFYYSIDDYYDLIYKSIKLELIITNNSILLDTIKCNKTDILFISKLIKKELDSLDSNNGNVELLRKVKKIRDNGFDEVNYLDKDLITLLIFENNMDLVNAVKNNFISNLEEYSEIKYSLSRSNDNLVTINDTIKELRANNRKIALKNIGKTSLIIAGIGLICFNISSFSKMSEKDAYIPYYKTYTSTYDSSNPDACSMTEEYKPEEKNSLTIKEYSSWDEPGYFRNEYTRNVYTYFYGRNSDIYFKDVKDYLNTDLKAYFTCSKNEEKVKELPIDEVPYTGNKYVASQVYQDKSDLIMEFSNERLLALVIGKVLINICGLSAVYLFFVKSLFSTKKYGNRKKNIFTISENKEKLIELKNSISENIIKLEDIKKLIDSKYEKLPLMIKEEPEIKEKMLTYKENEKES